MGGDLVDGCAGLCDLVVKVRVRVSIDRRLLIRQRRRLGGKRSMSMINWRMYACIAMSLVAVAFCK